MKDVAVAIIGGGPAGLTAAAHLARAIDGDVVVLDRESAMGGMPRHSDHPGYGLRDMSRLVSGPDYARRLTEKAFEAGAVLETSSMVTGWSGDRTFDVTSPNGRRTIRANAVILATGARERPRSARLIPGDRPDGIYTTGQLQNEIHLHHNLSRVGERAVVIGAELVSWSAVLTLREAGCRTVLMTSEHSRSESYAAFSVTGRWGLRVPVATRTKVTRIVGKGRVEAVEVEDLATGRRRLVACDTVVATGDWIPDHELARLGGLEMDPGTLGPRVDVSLRSSQPGVFAIGNLVHPVDTADAAALDGRHVAHAVRRFVAGRDTTGPHLELLTHPPLRWVAPQVWLPGQEPARKRLLFWADDFVRYPRVVATQDGREINSVRTPWPCAPGRIFRVPSSLLARAKPGSKGGVDPTGGPIHLTISR